MSGARRLRRQLLVGSLVGVVSAFAFAALSAAAGPTIQPSGTTAWTPNSATISTSETVTFKNPSASVPHGLKWTSGPSTPSCPGAPPETSNGTSWEGTCTFSQAGSYSFMCTVHAAMTGTITVTSGGPEPPTPTTGSASGITETGATLGGLVNPHGIETEYFFKYGIDTSYGQTTETKPAGEGTSNVNASGTVTGLTKNTTYHFRLVAESSAGTVEGADKTFTTTGPPLPTPTTGSASAITDTGATLGGLVNPHGIETEYFFKYGTGTSYGQTTETKPAGEGTSNASATGTATGLAPGTTYHFLLVAVSSAGTAEGVDQTFTTTGPPVATTNPANAIGTTQVTLQGTVNPRGHETTYFFEYGTKASYGQTTVTKFAEGTASVPATATISGLAPSTTYHFRLVANNTSGPGNGLDKTVTTASEPPPSPPPPPPGEETKPPQTTPPPTPEPTPIAPPGGPALGRALKVAGKGTSVQVGVQVLAAGAGGKLVVEVKSKGKKSTLAGKLVKAGVSAGNLSLKVPLNARAKSALKQSKRLSVSVVVTLIPSGGAAASATKSLVLTG